jgi:hypothetical protein
MDPLGGTNMPMKMLTLAAVVTLALSGAPMARTAGCGSAEGNMNNPGSVERNAEKGMSTGSSSMSAGTGPGTTGGRPVSTPGAPAGNRTGNSAPGSGAAPSGK